MDDDFIKAWMEGKVTPEELAKRKSQGDKSVDQLEDILNRSSQLIVPERMTKQMAWEKFSARVREQNIPKAKIIKWNRWVPVSIAASLTLFVITYFLVFSKTTIVTSTAQTLVYALPDGSRVTLNADSKISFKKFMWNNERTLTLEGEAFFEVKKGNTFTVVGSQASVTVLGTSFNVYFRQKNVKVACFSGKVKTSTKKNHVILTKGEFTVNQNDTLTMPRSFVEGQEATWRNGEFYFDSTSLRQVIDEMERQFNVQIEYHGDASKIYTGYFNTKSLDEALVMVFKPMSLRYRKEGNRILVE